MYALLFLALEAVRAQFRAGTISWDPIPGDPYSVTFTVKTAWLRSAGTYTKVVNGTPVPTVGYQPIKGDIINIAGYETPKFLTSDFQGRVLEEYLTATVTSNTESLPNGRADIGAGLPHTVNDWSYYANNWFEAVSIYQFTFPRRDITYPAELQGCCRQDIMRSDSTGATQIRDGTGILQLYGTPYTIRTYVRLDRDPPPISFLPTFFPFSVEQGASVILDLAILDYMATYRVNNPATVASLTNPLPWADVVIQDGKDAQGDLAQSLSRPATGRRRRLLQQPSAAPASGYAVGPDDLPILPEPAPVVVTAADTGNDVRMLPADPAGNPSLLTLFLLPGCGAGPRASLPAGMDTCAGSPVASYPDGGALARNFSSVLVPAGLTLALTDACEYSTPPAGPAPPCFRAPLPRPAPSFPRDAGGGAGPAADGAAGAQLRRVPGAHPPPRPAGDARTHARAQTRATARARTHTHPETSTAVWPLDPSPGATGRPI